MTSKAKSLTDFCVGSRERLKEEESDTRNSNTASGLLNTPVKAQGRIIGYLRGCCFVKVVSASKHRLRYPKPSWAIDCQAFDELIKDNASAVVIIDRESKEEFWISTQDFANHCFRFNRGYGDQYACPIGLFEVRGNGHRQLALWGAGEQ